MIATTTAATWTRLADVPTEVPTATDDTGRRWERQPGLPDLWAVYAGRELAGYCTSGDAPVGVWTASGSGEG